MNGKKAKKARRLVYEKRLDYRVREYFHNTKMGAKNDYCVADKFRRAYQQIKKLLRSGR